MLCVACLILILMFVLQYKVRIGELRSRTLNLSVWHAEPLGRNVFLGEVEVALGLWDWNCAQPLWQDLQPRVGRSKHEWLLSKRTHRFACVFDSQTNVYQNTVVLACTFV